VKAVVALRHVQLLQLDGRRVEGERDGVGELGVHQQRRLGMDLQFHIYQRKVS